jgi:hypothetical protein
MAMIAERQRFVELGVHIRPQILAERPPFTERRREFAGKRATGAAAARIVEGEASMHRDGTRRRIPPQSSYAA